MAYPGSFVAGPEGCPPWLLRRAALGHLHGEAVVVGLKASGRARKRCVFKGVCVYVKSYTSQYFKQIHILNSQNWRSRTFLHCDS